MVKKHQSKPICKKCKHPLTGKNVAFVRGVMYLICPKCDTIPDQRGISEDIDINNVRMYTSTGDPHDLSIPRNIRMGQHYYNDVFTPLLSIEGGVGQHRGAGLGVPSRGIPEAVDPGENIRPTPPVNNGEIGELSGVRFFNTARRPIATNFILHSRYAPNLSRTGLNRNVCLPQSEWNEVISHADRDHERRRELEAERERFISDLRERELQRDTALDLLTESQRNEWATRMNSAQQRRNPVRVTFNRSFVPSPAGEEIARAIDQQVRNTLVMGSDAYGTTRPSQPSEPRRPQINVQDTVSAEDLRETLRALEMMATDRPPQAPVMATGGDGAGRTPEPVDTSDDGDGVDIPGF